MLSLMMVYSLLSLVEGFSQSAENLVADSIRELVSDISVQLSNCVVVVLSDFSLFPHLGNITYMSTSPNSSDLLQVLKASYSLKCTSYLTEAQHAEKFLTALNTARLKSEERHNPKVVIIPDGKEHYAEIVFAHKEALHIPDMIAIEIDDESTPVHVKLNIFTNRFQGNNSTPKGELLAVWPVNRNITYFPDKIQNLQGKEMIIAILKYPPFTITEPELDGIEGRLLVEFCKRYNCRISLLEDENLWGQLFDNGTGVGGFGNVYMDKADVGMAAFYAWEEEHHYLDYSNPYTSGHISALVPKPKPFEEWRTVFLPFSNLMWGFQVMSILMAAAVMHAANLVAFSITDDFMLRGEFATGVGIFFRALAMAFLQPPPSRLPIGNPLRRFFTTFEVLFLFFTTIYAGALSSVLTIPKFYPPIDSALELYEAGIPWAGLHSIFINTIKESTEPHLVGLVERFEVHDADTISKIAKDGGYGLCIEIMTAGHIVEMEFINGEMLLEYHVMKNELYSSPVIFILRKGSAYLPKLNQLLGWCRDAGLFLLWETDISITYLNSRLQLAFQISHLGRGEVHHPTKLKVSHIQGAFILLAFGFSVSLTVFFLELISLKSNKLRLIIEKTK